MKQNLFFVRILLATDKKAGSGAGSESISPWYGSADLYQNVTDPQNWLE